MTPVSKIYATLRESKSRDFKRFRRLEAFLPSSGRPAKEAKIKAVHTDPLGRFQAFLFLHPKQRDKAYEVLRRHFKTAFIIAGSVMADLGQ